MTAFIYTSDFFTNYRIAIIGSALGVVSLLIFRFGAVVVHESFLLLYVYTLGFWYGLSISYAYRKVSSVKQSAFFLLPVLSACVFLFVLWYMGKRWDMLFYEVRRITSGGIGAIFFLLLCRYFFKLKIKYYYYILSFVIGSISTSIIVYENQNVEFSILLWQVAISIIVNLCSLDNIPNKLIEEK